MIPSKARATVEGFYLDSMIVLARWGERVLGAGSLFWLLLPWTFVEILRRIRDYRYFRQLRETLPPEFWQGNHPLRHFLRMIVAWQGTLCACLIYERLHAPAWRKRIQVVGDPPDRLPEWGKRPVVLVFLHTGGFGMLRYWLRSRGLPVAGYVGGLPAPLVRPRFNRVLDEEDRLTGLSGLSRVFFPRMLRRMVRFLLPGRVLLVALDGIATSGPLAACPVDEGTLHVKDGAFRLAARSSAILIPVTVRQKGFLRFAVSFGEPVPDEFLLDPEPHRAHRELVRQLWTPVKEDPGSLTWSTLESLAPGKKRSRSGWP